MLVNSEPWIGTSIVSVQDRLNHLTLQIYHSLAEPSQLMYNIEQARKHFTELSELDGGQVHTPCV